MVDIQIWTFASAVSRIMTKLYRLCATILWVSTIVIWQPVLCYATNIYSESDAAQYLDRANHEMALFHNKIEHANWNWKTNMTAENAEKKNAIMEEYRKFAKKMHEEMIKYPWNTYKDPNIKRQFKLFSEFEKAALPKDKFKKFHETVLAMLEVYGKATIPGYHRSHSNRSTSLEPNITDTLAMNYDEEEYLRTVWTQWEYSRGRKVKHLYPEYVELSNEAARLNNYTDTADMWIANYEYKINDFRERMEHLWKQIKPLYLQIHAYTRKRLWKRYGSSIISIRGSIPLHLMDDLDITLPYPKVDDINPTSSMKRQNYSVTKMFKVAEEFYTSLNLSAMPESFWEKSILEKPSGRDILCHASAWDFYDSKDYRIKQCASVKFEDFLTAHHEMGHIQYCLQYKDQPFIYQNGANDGFHEAIGDTISLSVTTPKHLYKIGLIPERNRNFTDDINYLYKIGLHKIALLPFSYVMDIWRWNVFKGITTKDNYNCDWWDLWYTYQGYEPPVNRSENDFDPGSRFHIIANVPYIRYFISYIIQFQFHQALCEKAGQFDPNNPNIKPLHECDIYQNTKAGNALKEMLKLGSSKPWFDAMELLTGQREIDAGPLLNYFRPLHEWLEKENRRNGEFIGWETKKTTCIRAAGAKSGRHAQDQVDQKSGGQV